MLRDFEVLVVDINGRGYYSDRLKRYVVATTRKWIHIKHVRSHAQAVVLAQKTGRRILGVRKFDPTRSLTNIEKLQCNHNTPMTAIQMDELIVIKQRKKINNRWKDKTKILDNE